MAASMKGKRKKEKLLDEDKSKRICTESDRLKCIIHHDSVDDTENLIAPQDADSWKVLLRAAEIRNHSPILSIAMNTKDEVPPVFYHRKCRSLFTMKKSLDSLASASEKHEEPTRPSRLTRTQSSSTIYSDTVCIFCNKSSKYMKNENSRENLVKCTDLRADDKIRKLAIAKGDTRIMALVTRELVAAEAHYHRSCYRSYTRQKESGTTECQEGFVDYSSIESEAYEMLFEYIRTDLLENPRVTLLCDLTQRLVSSMRLLGIPDVKESTKTHIRRHLESEFGKSLHFQTVEGKRTVMIIPDNLTAAQLAKENFKLQEKIAECEKTMKDERHIIEAALCIRQEIKNLEMKSPWPPKPSDLHENAIILPDSLFAFLYTLLTGNAEGKKKMPPRVYRLINSFGQDIIYGVSCGAKKPPKHILLPYAIKSLTNNVELIQFLNRCGHGISYSQLEELDTALCLQKMGKALEEGKAILPENIHPYVCTTLAWDNIDRQEEILSGAGTSHRINGIAIQSKVFGPHLPSSPGPIIEKSRRRSLELPPNILPIYNAGNRVGPPSRKYVEVTSETILQNAWKKNLLWIIARLHAGLHKQNIGSWTGFNILCRDDVFVSQDNIGYLPTIDAPATDLSTVHEVLLQSVKIKNTLSLRNIVVVFDQALYAKAVEIIWKKQEQFKDIVPRMGAFHTICTLFAVIGKRFQDAGLKDLCVEAAVIAEGSVSGVLEGRRYNRGVRFHKLMYEALMRLAWKGFKWWLKKFHNDKIALFQDALDSLESLWGNVCHEEFKGAMESPGYFCITELFSAYLDFLRDDNGDLSQFWMSYIDMVEIMLNLIRASREGDWILHLSAIRALIPWCFAYDNLNYAKYLTVYLSQMSQLEEENPDVQSYLISGGFSVQIGDSNTFGRIPVDQACEETVNKDTKARGGTTGFSLKPGAVSRYYMVAEYRSIFLGNLREMLHLKSFYNHHDMQGTRKQRDEKDVKSLVDLMENTWTNPFEPEHQDLVSLSTGKAVPPEVKEDLLLAKEKGEEEYRDFSKERIETSPPDKDFHHKMTKLKLKTFSDLNKKKKVSKGNGKEIILKADKVLFGQMIVIAQSRNLSMSEVIAHPLGPLPWSLATPDGSLRTTNKSALANELHKNASLTDVIPTPSCVIIDGMALVQRLKGDQKTFEGIAESLLCMALNESIGSSRTDVVFDVYKVMSIKNAERQRRSGEASAQYKNISPGHKIQQWKKFLGDPCNKQALIAFLFAEWRKEKYRKKLNEKLLFVTSEDQCVKITQGEVEMVDDLKSTHEEADTRLLLHSVHAAKEGFESVIIVSEDTDVFILSLAYQNEISSSIYVKCGKQTRTRYVGVFTIAEMLGEKVCKALPGLHALTGCDTVSAFAGKGKLNGLKILKKDQSVQLALQHLGNEWELSPSLFKQLEKFVCQLYSATPNTESVNTLRYMLFCAKKGEIDSQKLSPCSNCLQKHCERANYQAGIWRQCLVACPDIPSPDGLGWLLRSEEDGTTTLTVDWMSGNPAPLAVLELLSCGCKRSCQPSECSCIRNGLKCTDMCLLKDCNNRPNDGEEFQILGTDDVDSDDNDDYDEEDEDDDEEEVEEKE